MTDVAADREAVAGLDSSAARPGDADAELVAAALEGNARAFEQLLTRHEARVLRVLRLLGIPPSDREDVAQEIFVRVFRHLGGFRPDRPFTGWVYRITVNAAHDFRRQSARRRARETSWDESFDQSPSGDAGPAEALDRQDRRRSLESALVALTERERAVFVLCELEGQESRQVGRSLGISGITVRRHLSRARRRLQRVLEQQSEKNSPGG